MLFYILIGILLFLFVTYLILIFPDTARREQMQVYKGQAFAHRGLHDAQNLCPENSMAAFKEAVKRGLAIELDIHLTRDRKVVVFHDELLERVCNVQGTVEASTYDELLELHLLNTNQRIPLFTEVLDYIDGRVPLLIEIKLPTKDMRLCTYALNLLKDYKGPFLVQSFNCFGMRWFRKNAPDILRGQLSSALTKSKTGAPYMFRFCVQHLLTNVLCRPDFISYKLADTSNMSLRLNHRLFKIPVAVWTLRSEKACKEAIGKYDMFIFEKEQNVHNFTAIPKDT